MNYYKETQQHKVKIHFKIPIVNDGIEYVKNPKSKMKWDKWGNSYRVKKGDNVISLSSLRGSNIGVGKPYSTVVDCFKKYGLKNLKPNKNHYDSIIIKFNLLLESSKLTKPSHYTKYQQKLYNEVKRLKEDEDLGYRRISYLLYDRGYRGIRNNQILKNNDIYSIYKKGKIREERINREFKNVVSDIVVYEY